MQQHCSTAGLPDFFLYSTRSNLYTLEGGVHNYLRQEGGDGWNGSLFVFDDRLAVPAVREGSPAVPTSGGPVAGPNLLLPSDSKGQAVPTVREGRPAAAPQVVLMQDLGCSIIFAVGGSGAPAAPTDGRNRLR